MTRIRELQIARDVLICILERTKAKTVNAPEYMPTAPPDMHVVDSTGMRTSELLDILASKRLFAERIQSLHGALSEKNIAVLHRAQKVWPRAVNVLSDQSAARAWLTQSNRSLGGKSPLELLDDEDGCTLVLDTLGRIEYGIVS